MKIRYLTNLMDPIVGSDKKFSKDIDALLVSASYSSKFKEKTKNQKLDFILSDNGNFTRIGAVAKLFRTEAEKLELEINKYKGKASVPKALVEKQLKLNAKIIAACKAETAKIDYTKVTSTQMSIAPQGMIGAEDLTIPVLYICGAFNPLLGKNIPNANSFQLSTQKLFAQQIAGAYGSKAELKKSNNYLVIHANDYASAVSAIKFNKKTKYEGIAVSLGGPLEHKGYLSEVKVEGKVHQFPEPQPESYILSIVLLLAFRNYVSKATPIHVLGLGSPILIALVGYMFREFKFVTIDSTATYKDVEVNYIYGNKNGLYKMDLFKLAAYCVVNNSRYEGSSPIFRAFDKKYPQNWSKLKLKCKTILENKKLSSKEVLKRVQDFLEKNPRLLAECVPFLTPMHLAKKSFVKELRQVRAFENYWVNHTLCEEMSSFSSVKKLEKFVRSEVELFAKFGSKNYVEAVQECIKLVDKHRR